MAVRRRRYERLALVLALVIAVTVTTVALRDAAARSPRSPEAGGPGRERLSLPEMCGSTTPLTRRDSRVEAGLETWTIRTSGWHGARTVEVAAGPASSGDLFGGRDDSAVVPVTCSNDGGTADGQLLFAEVVYRRVRGRLLPVAVLTPRVTGRYPAHVPLQELTDVAPGRIVTTEAFYGPGDPTCCATGLATTTWLFRDGEVFSTSRVVRAPYGARHGSRAPRRVPRAMVLVRESSPADVVFDLSALIAQVHLSPRRWLVAGLTCPPGGGIPDSPCLTDLVLAGAVRTGHGWRVDARARYGTASVGDTSDCLVAASRGLVPGTTSLVVSCLNGGSDGESFVAVFGLPPGAGHPAVLLTADCGTTTFRLAGASLILRSWPLHSGANDVVPQQPAFVYRWQRGSLRGRSLETALPVRNHRSNRPGFCTAPGDLFGDV